MGKAGGNGISLGLSGMDRSFFGIRQPQANDLQVPIFLTIYHKKDWRWMSNLQSDQSVETRWPIGMLDIQSLQNPRPVESICNCKINRPLLVMSKSICFIPNDPVKALRVRPVA